MCIRDGFCVAVCNCSLSASYLETCTLRILVRSIREPDPALKDEGPQRASGMRIREIRASPPDTIACCYSTGLKIRKEEYFSMDLSKKRDAHTRSLCLHWEGAAPLQLLHPVCACRNSSRSQPAHRPLAGSNCHLQWSTSEEKKKKHTLKKLSEVHTQDDTYRCVHPGRQKPDRLHSIESKGGVQEKAGKDS